MKLVKALVCALALAVSPVYTNALSSGAEDDLVVNLPGQPAGIKFKQYAGYVPLKGDNTKQMFYWHVEAEADPSSAPVIIWTNGGPGCSGLGGMTTEQGPWRPQQDGTLKLNDFRWNQIANMVFIEQPLGVGFSYSETPYASYGDQQAANDNYDFIVGFLKKFPQYKGNDLYLTSESYGGHYLPTLAKELVMKGGVNFKGFAVGNPLTYMPYRNYGQYGTFAGHNLLPKPLVDRYNAANCRQDDSSDTCQDIENEMSTITTGLDPYALDFPVCADDVGSRGRNDRYNMIKLLMRANGEKKRHNFKGYFPAEYQPCDSNWAEAYLNRDDVQAAIHAKKPAQGWADCNGGVSQRYNTTDVLAPMMPIYQWLINTTGHKLNILIYSGDDDSVCATLGSQEFIWNLGYDVKEDWQMWTTNHQVSGYVTKFDGFTFATVHGAGHMVPATRPEQALQVLKNFLTGKW